MNPITKIQLENFQSHQKTAIEIAPNGQLTVIVGPSDTGKTVILRALRWVFYNQPQGSDFIRAGATYARVTVEFASGHIVVRHRSTGSINRYLVNGETYEGFGGSVPLEIQDVTGVRPVTIGDMDLTLNLAEQLDGPFLGRSISAGARAKVLGKLAGTEEIDLAGKRLGTDLFRSNQEEKRLKASLVETRDKIAGYDYLPAMKQKIEKLEALAATIKKAQERRRALVELKGAHDRAETGALGAMAVIRRWRGIREAEGAVRDAEAAAAQKNKTLELHDKFINLRSAINHCLIVIDKWAGMDDAEALVKEAEAAAQKKRQIEVLDNRLEAASDGILNAWLVIDKWAGLKNTEALVREAEAAAERRQQLEGISQKHYSITIAIEYGEDVLKRLKGLPEAEEVLQFVANSLARKTALVDKKHDYEQVEKLRSLALVKLVKYQYIDEAEAQVSLASKAEKRLLTLLDLENRHKFYGKEMQDCLKRVDFYKEQVSELEAAYLEGLVAAGVCPTCGQKTCKENLKEAI